jgi:DNA excision repair protein ERCC-4
LTIQEFQQDIFAELRADDELVVLARGLGLLRIVTNLLHSYDAAGNNLVVVVGAEERENYWIGEALAEQATVSKSSMARGLRMINTDTTSVPMREKIYSEGGIVSVTSRILVVDLLSKLLDPETVTGLVILHAEKVVPTAVEAFIVRVYRQFNKIGFLKAFSDSPEHFVGFAPLSNILQSHFLKKVSLWPRYHLTVKQALEGRKKAEVIELEVPMSDAMTDIQNAILECVEVSIKELKKANTGLEMEDWTLDSALHKNFDVIIRRQLDPVWHRVSYRTRQIASDLATLRNVLHCLLSYDCVSLNKYLDTILAAHSPPPGSTRQNQSPWLFLEAANTMFHVSKGRVYSEKAPENMPEGSSSEFMDSLRPVLEEQPKWKVLAEVLMEIEQDNYLNPVIQDDSSGAILIMCGDQRTCRQIREYLETMHVKPDNTEGENTNGTNAENENKPSAKFILRRKLREYLDWKRDFAKVSAALFAENEKTIHSSADRRYVNSNRGKPPPNKRRRVRGGATTSSGPGRGANGSVVAGDEKASEVAGLLAELQPSEVEAMQKQDVVVDELEDMEDFFELYEMQDLVVVHPFEGDLDEHVLEEVKPRYIIMYEPDAAFIRRVEVYRSSHSNRGVRVFFMYYGGSVEEQRYLSAVRREKDAFTKLIKEKAVCMFFNVRTKLN